jgi:hypothetical protein
VGVTNEFYVGYAPKMPIGLRVFLRRVVVTLGLLAIAVAIVLLSGQMPFAKSTFEFGKDRSFEGILETTPYPSLLVDRPGAVGFNAKYSRYLLVAPGKHGANMLFEGMNSKRVHLKGQLIYRAGRSMIEVEPSSVQTYANVGAGPDQFHSLGEVSVTGEIVDSKCYLGVMNPAMGKVHRDCASRCISGGIPPIFVTSTGDQFLLVGPDEQPFHRDALRKFIAEPISVQGELLERGDSRYLKIDLAELHHN